MNPASAESPVVHGIQQVNKWIIAFTVMFGTFMAVMDISIVNVAMPHMMGTFGTDLSAITWVATSYSIAEIILVTMAGWLTTLLGRKRLYLGSFAIFVVASALCGTARSFHTMLFYRVLQGIGGGALIPVSQAILRETFPEEEQGMAMALYSMGVVVAPAIGPVAGGWLTDHYGWPWVFLINLPVGIAGILMVSAFVHDPPYLRRGVRKVDWLGIALLTIGMTTMQAVLERGEAANWFESRKIVIGSAICAATLIFLVVWELHIEEPVINFRILKNLPLTLGSVMGIVFGVALFGTTFILPQFTQNLLGYSAYQAGVVLMPRAIAMVLFMPVIGRLYNQVDPRILVLLGTAVITWSYYDLSRLSLDAGFWNLVIPLIIMGLGMPAMFVTLSTVSLATIPRTHMTDAAGLYTLSRRVGGNIGYALAATFVGRGIRIHHAHLDAHISPLNPAYVEYSHKVTRMLTDAGLSPQSVPLAAHAMIERLVDLQATMLAYNDTSWKFGLMFLLTIPLILLLPGRASIRREAAALVEPPEG